MAEIGDLIDLVDTVDKVVEYGIDRAKEEAEKDNKEKLLSTFFCDHIPIAQHQYTVFGHFPQIVYCDNCKHVVQSYTVNDPISFGIFLSLLCYCSVLIIPFGIFFIGTCLTFENFVTVKHYCPICKIGFKTSSGKEITDKL